MGFLELLTLIFIVLQVTGVIAWSWWLVLLPAIIAAVFYLIWFIVATVTAGDKIPNNAVLKFPIYQG